jgi:hypothetical protein
MNRKFVNLTSILNPQSIRKMSRRKAGGKSATGAPNFPGEQSGLSIEEIRELVSMQPRQKGFTSQVAIGENVLDNLKLTGDARILLGINFNVASGLSITDRYSFTVNNNEVIEDVPVVLNSTQPAGAGIAYFKEPYVPIMQPLSGSDDLELVYLANVAGTLQFVLWYI